MVTFICNQESCTNKDISFDFLGNLEFAECGSCKTILIPINFRPDPELSESLFGDNNGL